VDREDEDERVIALSSDYASAADGQGRHGARPPPSPAPYPEATDESAPGKQQPGAPDARGTQKPKSESDAQGPAVDRVAETPPQGAVAELAGLRSEKILLAHAALTREKLDEALAAKAARGGRLGESLVSRRTCSEEQLAQGRSPPQIETTTTRCGWPKPDEVFAGAGSKLKSQINFASRTRCALAEDGDPWWPAPCRHAGQGGHGSA